MLIISFMHTDNYELKHSSIIIGNPHRLSHFCIGLKGNNIVCFIEVFQTYACGNIKKLFGSFNKLIVFGSGIKL